MDMAGLPSEDELLEEWDFDGRNSKSLKAARGRSLRLLRLLSEQTR